VHVQTPLVTVVLAPVWETQEKHPIVCAANPFELLQEVQSETTAPLGREAEAQEVQVAPIITLPLGQRHCCAVLLHDSPFRQTHPNELAKPFESWAYLQSVQKLLIILKF
jgi:hypothetical protein